MHGIHSTHSTEVVVVVIVHYKTKTLTLVLNFCLQKAFNCTAGLLKTTHQARGGTEQPHCQASMISCISH